MTRNCVHLRTSLTECTGVREGWSFAKCAERLVIDDDRDNAEKCDGTAEVDSWRCECSVAALAAEGVRDG